MEQIIKYSDLNREEEGFVADPFLVVEDSEIFVFFEIYEELTEGTTQLIGVGRLKNSLEVEFLGPVLQSSKYDFSFPFTFQYKGKYYLLPEISTPSDPNPPLRLYVSDDFPLNWNLYSEWEISGWDPVVFPYNDKRFLICSSRSTVNLYYSDSPVNGNWTLHPESPIANSSKLRRMGGRPLETDGKLYLFYQDCYWHYGEMVRCCEVVDLSGENFAQREIPEVSPIISGQYNHDWNHRGMHHIDIRLDDGFSIVDGRDKKDWSIGYIKNRELKRLTPSPGELKFHRKLSRYKQILFDILEKICWKLSRWWK